MSILAGLGAAAASFAMKEGHNAIAQSRNEKNMALEHDYWKRRVNQLEEMNKPSRQVAKWRSAGIAPQAVFGNSPGGAGIANDASAPNSQTPMGSSDFNFVTTIAERQRMDNEKAIADATVNKLNAEADKLRGDTKDPDVTKDSQRLEFDWNLVKKQREQIQLAVDEINKEFQRAVNEVDLQIKRGIYSETLSKIDKLIADKEVSEEMKQNLQKQRDLIKAQIDSTKAQTGLTQAQTETENQLRKLRKALTHNQINEITQRIRASRVVTAEGIERLNAWLRGDREASSLFGLIDKYITGTGKDLLSSQYNNDIRAYLYDLMNGASE
ncbi:hypothetical protein KSZ18_11435 [Alistipes finegoldii]|uniref:hypothetical protein n=2 Tax=Alistipes finegoldii TaxID=214856 RepID=UPI001C38AF31|nr:hypothetical protein [Alistipes finegoldii]MBV4350412.1 hypothetical protein [Alistipes finegoldii]